MKTATVALVLIVGAAVVLWFGNMVNSWVLGGLMGGLAALLLSIPISLTLFSFFSRRHDERVAVLESEEELSLAPSYDYYDQDVEDEKNPPMYVEVMEEGGYEYELPSQRERYEDRNSRRMQVNRILSAPTYPRLPAAGQSHASASVDSSLRQRESIQLPMPRQHEKVSPVESGKDVFSQHPSRELRTNSSGKLGYQGKITRSLHQSAALRVARQEARQRQGEDDVLSNTMYDQRRFPANRPVKSRVSRPLPRKKGYQSQKQRVVVASTYSQPGLPTTRRQMGGPRTEPINKGSGYPRTGPVRQGRETGELARNLQWDEEEYDLGMSTGSLKNPLVRRAPYMYENDALRQELAQQVDRPIVRRSSRYEEEE